MEMYQKFGQIKKGENCGRCLQEETIKLIQAKDSQKGIYSDIESPSQHISGHSSLG
jgi:hypothetical protein